MSETEIAVKEKSLAKGLVAGALGGLVGTLAKTLAERMFPPHPHDVAEAPEVATEAINWGFGAAVGAAYSVIVEYYPSASAREGASFGMALEALTHESALPALGLAEEPEDQTTRERVSEVTSHVVYGVTTEFVRKIVRKIL